MIGAKILGPRIGKYDKNGKPQAILGHNLTFAALGVFILWFCWFGFNGASTVGMDSDALIETAGRVFFNTNLGSCCRLLRGFDFHLDTLQETGCLYDLQCSIGRSGRHYSGLRCGRCGRRGGHWSCLWKS